MSLRPMTPAKIIAGARQQNPENQATLRGVREMSSTGLQKLT